MKLYINFEGVADHQDILSEELKKSERLMKLVQNISYEIPDGNIETVSQIRQIMESARCLQRNIKGRKVLLAEITERLRAVSLNTEKTVAEIEYQVNQLSDNGQNDIKYY